MVHDGAVARTHINSGDVAILVEMGGNDETAVDITPLALQVIVRIRLHNRIRFA